MPKASPIQSSFNAGEFGGKIHGRVDADRYKSGLATCLNFIPAIQGPLDRRPGSKWAALTSTGDAKVRLIPFEYSQGDSYVVEIGTLNSRTYVRFYKDKAPVLEATVNITGITAANPGVVTANAHGYQNGDEVEIESVVGMTQLNGRRFKVANKAANTFELQTVQGTNVNTSGYTAYSSGGTAARVYTLTQTTPPYIGGYADAELEEIQYAQSGNDLYLVHKGYKPAILTRRDNTDWVWANFDTNLASSATLDSLGPFITGTSTVTITPSAISGVGITLTASNGVFASSDVGVIVGVKHSTTWGYAVITAYTSSTLVTATVIQNFGASTASSTWNWTAWSATKGYPSAITFHQDRLVFAGIPLYPQTIFGSMVGSYKDFTPNGTADSDSITFTLNSSDVNKVNWLTSDEKGLLCGTLANEWSVSGSGSSTAITPTSVSAKKAGSYGSHDTQAIQLGKAAIYVQKSQRKVREFTYFYDVDGFKSVDLTELAQHVCESGVTLLAKQNSPQPIMWAVREDGVLAAMTYDRDSENLRVGWSRHIFGGMSDAAGSDPIVESIAVIPSSTGEYDELWLSVKRYMAGQTVRSIEYLTKFFDDEDEQRDGYFVDCGLSYDDPKTITGITKANPAVVTCNSHGFSNGDTVWISDVVGMTNVNETVFTVANKTANTFELSGVNSSAYSTYVSGGYARKYVSTISGLWHLEGETVDVCVEGGTHPQVTVASGAITLTNPATTVHVGYGYSSDMKMLRLDSGAADGTSIGKTRRTHRVGFMIHRSAGFKVGPSFDELDQLQFRTSSDDLSRPVPLKTDIVSENFPATYDFDNNICVRQDQPLACTILAIMPQLVEQDR